jgi:hypothetical protein
MRRVFAEAGLAHGKRHGYFPARNKVNFTNIA